MTTKPMRRIDYLELCQFVSARQDFAKRWLDRYWRMIRLYDGRINLLQGQIASIWGDEYELSPDEATQVRLLEIDLAHYRARRKRCYNRHSILIRYGQYFGQLPFRILGNQSIPDCFWYVPDKSVTPT